MIPTAIGIDIGGTKTRAAFLKGSRIWRAREAPTPKNKKQFVKWLNAIMPKRPKKRLKIGIGVAGVVQESAVIFSPNIGWMKNFDFKSLTCGGSLWRVDNDARCFVRAEIRLGAAKNFRSVFALTIGTGIGRAYAEKEVVKKIKKFERPEHWEKEYQRVRDRGKDSVLTVYLANKIIKLVEPWRPSALVIGGGVAERKKFLPRLRRELKIRGFRNPVLRPRFRKNAAAIGAVMS